jgi:aminoglycoside phosphotransferase (APT) family kinase protein
VGRTVNSLIATCRGRVTMYSTASAMSCASRTVTPAKRFVCASRISGRRWSRNSVSTAPAAPSFVHGDFGTANLLWRPGCLVVLDFDRCTRGDPASDLGYLLTQLRRVTLRKPGKLPPFTSLRSAILEAYQRWSPPDAALASRVAWYERATMVSKVHVLAFDLTRHPGAEARRQRQVEALALLQCLTNARDSDSSS